ncbi:hypothetical protein D3C73_940700 [compost metagenome]
MGERALSRLFQFVLFVIRVVFQHRQRNHHGDLVSSDVLPFIAENALYPALRFRHVVCPLCLSVPEP